MKNGTGQGKVASPALWNLYVLPLIKELRRKNIGCNIGGLFLASSMYAADFWGLSPSRFGSEILLRTCEKWAASHNVTFSTHDNPTLSKSTVLYVKSYRTRKLIPKPLLVNGKELPYVKQLDHLGHLLDGTGEMCADTIQKRYRYIKSSCEILDYVSFAPPGNKQKAVKIYSASAYGSNLWDFGSDEFRKFFNCWGRTVKDTFEVPYNTHLIPVLHCG